jgi:serine phosphatase RsbU (regulator of sigma subunit)/anti-sigma regulatory factor (Ser/Thr protein kinase)
MVERPFEHAPAADEPARRRRARYGFAVLLAVAGVLIDLLLSTILTGEPLYAVLVAVVALSTVYGGIRPGIVTAGCAWFLAIWVLAEPQGHFAADRTEATRWMAGLLVAIGVIVLIEGVRRGREQAATVAFTAEERVRDVETLQDFTAACSAAVTQVDVAQALIERMPRLLGARGGAVGLVDGDELVVVDPRVTIGLTHRPGARIPRRARAPIAQASATGRPVVVRDRETFERSYPDGVALTPYARAAVAVPLRVAGEVVGAASFLFDREQAMADDADVVARIAADLAGQALERARLYDLEHQSRRALDRILRMTPSFHGDSAESVTTAICREAHMALGADLGILWRLRPDGGLELVGCEPAVEPLVPGFVADLAQFPRFREAVERREVVFVPDVQAEARGSGLERVRHLGLRSSLRIPVVVEEEAEHVLVVSWQSVVTGPDASTMLLARRLADQVGLALEQLARRRAEAAATISADETRRLQEVTAGLSAASTAGEVGDICLEHAIAAVGADAGFVVLSRSGSVAVEMVSSAGYTEAELDIWRALGPDADVPIARALASGEPVWALTAEEMASFTGIESGQDAGWVTLPLVTQAGTRGVLHIAFRDTRELSEAERTWLQTVVSQCAQALERSLLFDEEQRLRARSERLQEMTAALANALTRVNVAEVVARGVHDVLAADSTSLALVLEDRRILRTLAWEDDEDADARRLEMSMDVETPQSDAVRQALPTFYETFDELRQRFPDVASAELADHESFLFVPLVAQRRVNGLLCVSWARRQPLPPDERRFVLSLAAQAAQALERAGHFESEQTIAATLQRSVLPTTLPRVEGVQLAARYLPGTAELNVGGDWFDAIPLRESRLGLAVGDVVGKGVRAAATMAQLRNALRAFSLDRTRPSSTLTRLNRLSEEVLETAFATVVYAVVDPRTLTCRYSSAGHPPPLVVFPDGRVELLEAGRGLPLGTGSVAEYVEDVVELQSGAVLVLYTDGLVERRGQSIDAGLEQLRAAVAAAPRDPELLVEHVLEDIIGATERDDDIALLAARVFAVAPRPLALRVPNDTSSLAMVRDTLRAWLEGAPALRDEAEEIVLATWEACANAIEHGGDQGPGTVRVDATLDEGRVQVVVEDSGSWRPPTETPGRGLGLRLIDSLVSSVDVSARDGGTRVTLEKELAGAAEPDGSI